jgi:hypothetical protein
VEDGVGFAGVLLQFLNGFERRQDEELDFATSSLTPHLIHHREDQDLKRPIANEPTHGIISGLPTSFGRDL